MKKQRFLSIFLAAAVLVGLLCPAALAAPEADLAALLEEQLRRQKTRIDTGKRSGSLSQEAERSHRRIIAALERHKALAGQAAHALHTLGLEKVWVACRCEAQMKEAERLLCPCSSADICIHLAGPEELAWGMALDAETKWFGTIYFCAQNPISPPL